ncbi:MAG: hypothetical protein ABR616_18285 [Dermatophilaceae bacterium]
MLTKLPTATTTTDLYALFYEHPDAQATLVTIAAGTVVDIDGCETDDGVRSYQVSTLAGTFRAYAIVEEQSLAF